MQIQNRNKIDIQELTLFTKGKLPKFKNDEIKLRLESDQEYKNKLNNILSITAITDDFFLEAIIKKDLESWRKEDNNTYELLSEKETEEYIIQEPGKAAETDKPEEIGKTIPLTPWYKSTVFRLAASIAIIGLSFGYWYTGIPQRAADGYLVMESKGDLDECNSRIQTVIKQYTKDKNTDAALLSIKKPDLISYCTATATFYEAVFLVKAKKYDEAKAKLNEIIGKTDDETLKINAQKLLDTL